MALSDVQYSALYDTARYDQSAYDTILEESTAAVTGVIVETTEAVGAPVITISALPTSILVSSKTTTNTEGRTADADVTTLNIDVLTADNTTETNSTAEVTSILAETLEAVGASITITTAQTTTVTVSTLEISVSDLAFPDIIFPTESIITSQTRYMDIDDLTLSIEIGSMTRWIEMHNAIKKGDTTTPLKTTLKDKDGAVNLSAASSVLLYMKQRDGTNKIDGKEMSITDAENGEVEYSWDDDDVDETGTFNIAIKVMFSDTAQWFPNYGFNSFVIDDNGE